MAGKRRARRQIGPGWAAEAEEAFLDLRGWREMHPRASLAEIERELDRRLEQMRARMLADLALASAAADLEGAAERAGCPDCGGPLRDEGAHERTLVTLGNQGIQLPRDYGTCARCGSGLFPPGR